MKKLTFFFALFLFISACNKDIVKSDAEITAEDDAAIQAYLKSKNLTAQKTPEGIYYIIEVEGTGNNATLSNTVSTTYKGYLLTGTVFDESTKPISFKLTGVILGWQIGLQKFKKGSKGKLFIPSLYAYGRSGTSGIAPNTPLAFDIEMIDLY